MAQKKLAIFSGYYLPFLGGIERYTNKLAIELQKLGYSVAIVTTNHDNLPAYERNEDGIAVYRLPSRKLFRQRYPIPHRTSEYHELMARIESEQFDYFWCNTRFQLTSFIGAKLANKQDKPVLAVDHGSSHFTVGNPVLDGIGAIYEHFLTALLKRRINAFYGVSQRCVEWLRHFRIEARGVFYNSVDESAFDTFKDQSYQRQFDKKVVITYAGRVMREKGVEMLVEAFEELENTQDAVLVIAGDGPILAELKQKHGNNRNVFFEGKLGYDETMKLMARTDIFCYPSMYPEGLPTSILEAGLMKSAVIATDRGGTKEVITSSEYGIIVEENRDSLKRALEQLIHHPSKVTHLKNNLHTRIKENFTWAITALKVSQTLKENRSEKN